MCTRVHTHECACLLREKIQPLRVLAVYPEDPSSGHSTKVKLLMTLAAKALSLALLPPVQVASAQMAYIPSHYSTYTEKFNHTGYSTCLSELRATKPADLSSILGAYHVKGDNPFQPVV